MDRLPLSRAVPIYLAALIMAIGRTPLDIYDFHQRGLGTARFEPWRRTLSAAVTSSVGAFRAVGQFLWGHRQGLAVAASIAVMLFAPHALQAHGVAFGAGALAGHLNVVQLETDLAAKKAAGQALLETTMRTCAEHVVRPATATEPEVKGRLMTAEEKGAIQAILDEAKGIKARIDSAAGSANMMAEFEKLTAGMQTATQTAETKQPVLKSIGQQLVDDPGWQAWIKNKGVRSGSAWTSPSVELHATTLDTSQGSGGKLIVTDYQAGILPLLFKRLTVADLIAPGTTDSNSITYFKETTFTNAAAAVAEGGSKPESTLIFDLVTDLVKKIAHWLPITEEMLEDFAASRSYVNARLLLGVALAEEDQLLNGSGVGANIQGILLRSGLTAAQPRGADSNADAIFKQITTISTTVFIQPDALVLNPINWQTIQLTKNANGNYLGTGPWNDAQPAQLWGYPVAVTPSIVANTGLVGAFKQAAQFFRKGGVRVEASNSHSDFFVKNLVAIRAEERGALAVYRPAAFGTVTGLN